MTRFIKLFAYIFGIVLVLNSALHTLGAILENQPGWAMTWGTLTIIAVAMVIATIRSITYTGKL